MSQGWMCFETAAGAGGCIVPTGRVDEPGMHPSAVPHRAPMYGADEMLTRRLQDEKSALGRISKLRQAYCL